MDKWLNHFLNELHLHPQEQESRTQMQRGGTPMHAKGWPPFLKTPVAECPPLGLVQMQVWLNFRDDFGEAPSLPMDLANFLGGNAANEWNDAPHPSAPSTARSSQLPHDNGHPHQRSLTQNYCQAHGCCLGQTPAQRDAWPSGSGWQLDLDANELGRKTPSVVEWASSSLSGPSGSWPLQCSQPRVFLTPDHNLQAAPCPNRSIWMVGGPSQPEGTTSLGLPAPSWFPWHKGLPHHQARGNPSLSPSPSMLYGQVRDTSWSPAQSCMNLQRCMTPLVWLDSGEIIEASLLGPTNDQPITPSIMEEEAVLLGEEPEPVESLEVTILSPGHLKTQDLESQEAPEVTTLLPGHPEIPEPEKWTEQSNT